MSEKFLIKGGSPLSGEVEISGYKNSAGAILAATLLADGPSIIDNLSLCSDVLDEIEIIKQMGGKIEWQGQRKIKIDPANLNPEKIPTDLFEKMRVSVLFVGPLLSKFKKLKLPHPGGDKIGLRPIASHIKSLEDFGVRIEERNGFYFFEALQKFEGKRIILEEFSVTATENIMMIAARIPGKTIIEIAAAEPQVQDLGMFLEKMGVKIRGVGTHTIEIEGRQKLSGAEFKISPILLKPELF